MSKMNELSMLLDNLIECGRNTNRDGQGTESVLFI